MTSPSFPSLADLDERIRNSRAQAALPATLADSLQRSDTDPSLTRWLVAVWRSSVPFIDDLPGSPRPFHGTVHDFADPRLLISAATVKSVMSRTHVFLQTLIPAADIARCQFKNNRAFNAVRWGEQNLHERYLFDVNDIEKQQRRQEAARSSAQHEPPLLLRHYHGATMISSDDEISIATRTVPVEFTSQDSFGGEVRRYHACHFTGLESVATVLADGFSSYVQSQFAQASSLCVIRRPHEVLIMLPWGEAERRHVQLALSPHLDDRTVRLLGWEIYSAARVAFGLNALAMPRYRSTRQLVKKIAREQASQNNNTNETWSESDEIAFSLGRFQAEILPRAIEHVLALRRRVSACAALPFALLPLTQTDRNAVVKLDALLAELVHYLCNHASFPNCDFIVVLDQRLLYCSFDVGLAGTLHAAYHFLRFAKEHVNATERCSPTATEGGVSTGTTRFFVSRLFEWPPQSDITSSQHTRLFATRTVAAGDTGVASLEFIIVTPRAIFDRNRAAVYRTSDSAGGGDVEVEQLNGVAQRAENFCRKWLICCGARGTEADSFVLRRNGGLAVEQRHLKHSPTESSAAAAASAIAEARTSSRFLALDVPVKMQEDDNMKIEEGGYAAEALVRSAIGLTPPSLRTTTREWCCGVERNDGLFASSMSTARVARLRPCLNDSLHFLGRETQTLTAVFSENETTFTTKVDRGEYCLPLHRYERFKSTVEPRKHW